MELDITKTSTLLYAYEKVEKPASFLRDRYFPTNKDVDVFATDTVLVDYQADGGKKATPFVIPTDGTTKLTRDGFHTDKFLPPLLAPEISMSIDDLKKRGFGEAVFSGLAPAERELALALRDLKQADETITRREELMAAETMTTDGCVMTPSGGTANVVVFHSGSTNPYQYAPAKDWSDKTANIMGDIYEMARMLINRGIAATDLVIAGDVAADILANENMLKLLDIRNVNIGGIAPETLPTGATLLGTVNIYGVLINIICYAAQYQDTDDTMKPVLPNGTVICTAPAAGRGLYGCITQLEETDMQFHSYAAARVPKYVSTVAKNTRSLVLSAAPLLIPRYEGGWIVAKVHTAG